MKAGASRLARGLNPTYPPDGGSPIESRFFAEAERRRRLDAATSPPRRLPTQSEVLRVVPLETYTFELPTGSSMIVPLSDVISGVGFRSCALQLRVHATTLIPGGSEAAIFVHPAARDPLDPTELLVDLNPVAFVSFGNGTVAPALAVDVSTVAFPPSFRVVLEWIQVAPGAATFTIGVDIVLRK